MLGHFNNFKSKIKKVLRSHGCHLCDYKSKTKSDLNKHIKIHGIRTRQKCRFCEYSCVTNQAMRAHLQNQHQTDSLYSCSRCKASFKLFKEFKQHTEENHQGEEDSTDKDEIVGDLVGIELVIPFKRKRVLILYLFNIAYLSIFFLYFTQNTNPIFKFECSICKKGFQIPEKFEKHEKFAHVNEVRTFSCFVCDGLFESAKNLKNHIKNKHITDHPFKCQYQGCDYSGKTKHMLHNHALIHKEYSHICKFCKFSSAASSGLRRHMIKWHGNDDLYECKPCCLTFKYKTQIVRHIKLIHKNPVKSLKGQKQPI